MYHIAVVEDEKLCSRQIQSFLEQYQEENSVRFKVSAFETAVRLLCCSVSCRCWRGLRH